MNKYIKSTLFESTSGYFELFVQGASVTSNGNNIKNLIYTTQGGTISANPNTFLCFMYKDPEFANRKTLFTSFAHLYKIKKGFREMADAIENKNVFINDQNGKLIINPDFTEYRVLISELGNDKKWISLTPYIFEDDSQIQQKGILFQVSNWDYASVLNTDEFLTVYNILETIDLASIQVMFSAIFYYDDQKKGQQSQVQAYQPQPYHQNNYNQTGYQQNPNYKYPNYNNQNYSKTYVPKQNYGQQYHQQNQQQVQPNVQPAQYNNDNVNHNNTNLPPRQESNFQQPQPLQNGKMPKIGKDVKVEQINLNLSDMTDEDIANYLDD